MHWRLAKLDLRGMMLKVASIKQEDKDGLKEHLETIFTLKLRTFTSASNIRQIDLRVAQGCLEDDALTDNVNGTFPSPIFVS